VIQAPAAIPQPAGAAGEEGLIQKAGLDDLHSCGPTGTPGISKRPSPSVNAPVSASPSICTKARAAASRWRRSGLRHEGCRGWCHRACGGIRGRAAGGGCTPAPGAGVAASRCATQRASIASRKRCWQEARLPSARSWIATKLTPYCDGSGRGRESRTGNRE
jgi:hypothetical protein